MRKNEEKEVEILKAVAQAWHGHSTNPRTTREFDAHRRQHRYRPTRFRQEVKSAAAAGTTWDFGQSLWDSYEIVTLCRKLEAGVALDQPIEGGAQELRKRRRESKNSLRNLINRISSRRFDVHSPTEEDDDTALS
ncbi:hypothetical protein H6P81_012898 [Aristolochia fimbriata]|uniref:Uncharacterized protein n=1 Tax=Aristolochia fimbriata TaxID=158543 RepID=A0AAV7EFB0_ARIFI|nr:hypothetical protein H6P81_012898 [Aristolochia fimbriata]